MNLNLNPGHLRRASVASVPSSVVSDGDAGGAADGGAGAAADDVAAATAALAARVARLQGHHIWGCVTADVAPVEAAIDVTQLLRLLQTGVALHSAVTAGAAEFTRCGPLCRWSYNEGS